VTFRVLEPAAPVAVRLVGRLLQNNGASAHGSLEKGVDVSDANIEMLGDRSKPLRVPVLRASLAHHDDAVISQLHFGMSRLAVRAAMTKSLAEAKRLL